MYLVNRRQIVALILLFLIGYRLIPFLLLGILVFLLVWALQLAYQDSLVQQRSAQ